MAKIVHRSNTIGIVSNSLFAPGSAYTVTAYDVGGQVEAASAGTSVALRSGHGFEVGDKFIVQQSSDGTMTESTYREVDAVDGDTLTISAILTVSVGDILVNLGPDNGGGPPAYDESTVVTYSDMDATTTITDSTVTANSAGAYSYWTDDRCWELIRDSAGEPIAVVIDAVKAQLDDYNIVEYGASTSAPDNRAAIQRAIDAASAAGGGRVIVPTGTFLVDHGTNTAIALELKDNVSIVGMGWASVLKLVDLDAGDWTRILVARTETSYENISIENLTLHGNSANDADATAQRSGIFMGSASINQTIDRIRIDRVQFLDWDGPALYLYDGTDSFQTTISDVVISRCTINETNLQGILISGGNDIVVRDNYITGSTTGIKTEAPSIDLTNASIVNNTVEDCLFGILMQGTEKTSPAESTRLRNLTISGNMVSNPGSVATGGGIAVQYCENVSITGNTVKGMVDYGIQTLKNSDKITITGNTVLDTAGSAAAFPGNANAGISIAPDLSTSDEIVISGNVISGGNARGICVGIGGSSGSTTSNVTISNNVITDPTRAHVDLLDVYGANVTGNVFHYTDASASGPNEWFLIGGGVNESIVVSTNVFRNGTASTPTDVPIETSSGATITDLSVVNNIFPDGVNHLTNIAHISGDFEYHGNVGGTAMAGGGFTNDLARRGANEQRMVISQATTEETGMSGATVTATSLIPAGSLVVGVTARVTTLITSGDGGTDFDIGDGTTVNEFGDAIAFAADTTADLEDHVSLSTPKRYASATDVVLTCNSGTFSAGAVRLTVHYIDLTAETS